MMFIKHRVNESSMLKDVDTAWGVEIDLRSDVNEAASLHLSHDPYVRGENFKDWLNVFRGAKISGPIFLNTKEDGLESTILKAIEVAGLKNELVFLDTALPTLVRWTGKENRDSFAVRISAFEPLESALKFKGKVRWAWVDCFDGKPIDAKLIAQLRPHFKICLVSPELQGVAMPLTQQIKNDFAPLMSLADALCTKTPRFW